MEVQLQIRSNASVPVPSTVGDSSPDASSFTNQAHPKGYHKQTGHEHDSSCKHYHPLPKSGGMHMARSSAGSVGTKMGGKLGVIAEMMLIMSPSVLQWQFGEESLRRRLWLLPKPSYDYDHDNDDRRSHCCRYCCSDTDRSTAAWDNSSENPAHDGELSLHLTFLRRLVAACILATH